MDSSPETFELQCLVSGAAQLINLDGGEGQQEGEEGDNPSELELGLVPLGESFTDCQQNIDVPFNLNLGIEARSVDKGACRL